jgi:hypothetical protein
MVLIRISFLLLLFLKELLEFEIFNVEELYQANSLGFLKPLNNQENRSDGLGCFASVIYAGLLLMHIDIASSVLIDKLEEVRPDKATGRSSIFLF